MCSRRSSKPIVRQDRDFLQCTVPAGRCNKRSGRPDYPPYMVPRGPMGGCMNNLALLSALAFEPRKAFDEIAQRPRFWFPLLLLIVASVGLSVWYCSIVDIQWLTDQTLRNSGLTRRMTEEQIEAAIARGTRGTIIAQALIVGSLGLVLLRVLESVYLLLAGKITNVQRSFRQWFALSCWTSLPGVLAVVPAAMVLLGATSAQIPQADLQPLSFNELLLHLTPKDSGYLLWSNFGVLSLLSLYLSSLGVKLWSGRSWLFSVLFATLPVLLLVGIVLIRS